MRYPIFLLCFGPPIFRSAAIDATKGVIDVWSFIQFGFFLPIVIRAIYRLASANGVLIPKRIRSILTIAFLLGLVFLASAAYSPSRFVSAAYSMFYFLTLICVVEFVADVYWDPPDWFQCLFHLRLIAFLLFTLVLLTLPFDDTLVLTLEKGVRLGGGTVAPVGVIGSVIAIVSAYSFLHGLEPRFRSILLFLVGITATFLTRTRGDEIALLVALAFLAFEWAKTRRRFAYIATSGFVASILLFGAVIGTIGAGRMWSIFNRGKGGEAVLTASGRTEIWEFVIRYCIAHPLGMGYIAGFRAIFREHIVLGQQTFTESIGNAHNIYMQTLADAGWLALAIYLIMLIKIVLLAWRFVKASNLMAAPQYRPALHAIRCALLLLVFCLADGMDTADFAIPLRTTFNWQYIIFAIILGASSTMLVASRPRHISQYERNFMK